MGGSAERVRAKGGWPFHKFQALRPRMPGFRVGAPGAVPVAADGKELRKGTCGAGPVKTPIEGGQTVNHAVTSRFEAERGKTDQGAMDRNQSRSLRQEREIHLQRGQFFAASGKEDDALFFLLDGRVNAVVTDENGREHILYVVEKGDILGQLCPADGPSSPVVFVALEDCRLVMKEKNELFVMLKDNPSLALKIMRSLSEKLSAVSERVKELAFCTVRDRILSYLVRTAQVSGKTLKESLVIEVGPRREEIARSCGCSRETVSRVIRRLVDEKVLVAEKRSYTIRLR